MAVNSAKQDELQKEVPKRVTLVRMYSYLLGYKKTLLYVAVLILITLAATLAGPLMIERAVDVYVANADTEGLIRAWHRGTCAFFSLLAVHKKIYDRNGRCHQSDPAHDPPAAV